MNQKKGERRAQEKLFAKKMAQRQAKADSKPKKKR
jgi:hypothetical protein